MQKKSRVIAGAALAAIVAVSVAACGQDSPGPASANSQEQHTQATIQNQMLANQPIPVFDRSEYRNTLITVENAEARGVATTSFFFNQGVKDPIFVCPSLGFPIPSTAQLTNPQQPIWKNGYHEYSGVTVGQMDPTGVYTGDSTGTYVECVSPQGTKYAKYWEGFVDTIGGPAHWDGNSEVLDGAPTTVVNGK